MNIQRSLGTFFFILAIIGCYGESVSAQNDQCRDVLKSGTLQTVKIRENSFFKQIIYSRFVSATYEQAKNDSSLGFGVPVGEIVLGANFTGEQFKQKKKDLENEGFQSITSSREIDVALTSGDPTIINAWSDCMKSKGGLSLRFEPVSPTEVFATLEWLPMAGITQTTLDDDINFPSGVTVSQGAGCFKNERPLIASRPCEAVINLPSAATTLAIAINTPQASTRAYLPARIELKKEVKNYELKAGDVLYAEAFRTYKAPVNHIKLSNKEIEDGWAFDASSAKVTVERLRILGNNYCREHQKVDSYNFIYGFNLEGNRNGSGKNSTAVCRVTPSIMLVRERWVPASSKSSTQQE